jgi:hypothetical protein
LSRVAAALAVALAVASFDLPAAHSHPWLAAALALPADRLHFGLTNSPSDLGWMTSSGVPWRYRYVYLAGGVNTSNPWQNWNSPAGAYATNYMNASGANGYIPVFTYYEMLQSMPSTGANESDRDFSNLNNTSTMSAYYANFKLLMQLAGSFGKAVVVHVEPDLWGYLEQRAAGGDASTLTASVASSGFAEASGLPNTVQGFAWTLLKLRDLYAPNANLAIHASPWGSGIDIASDTNPAVNAVAEADKTAAFLNSAGVSSNPYGSTWDVVFNDLDDHDAGWWEQQGADNAYFTHWWDPTNTTYPNFNRYLAWVAELHTKTARPQIAWQVPVGNQYYLTMNNTCGHYQDNVAPYFIAHPADLFASGLIAVLFGAGNGCQTTNTDTVNDGLTNNAGVPTTDTLGHCSACNTHASSWADDDGGYLRIFVGAYYSGWTSLNGILISGPGVSSLGTARTDVFAAGGDRGLWQITSNGTSWGGWAPLGGVVTGDPGAVSWGPNRIDVFVRGQDSALYHRFSDGASWSGWEGLGGRMSYGPAVASWGSNRLDIFITGVDHELWHRCWCGTGWGPWEPLGGVLTSKPAAVSWTNNRIDIFARGQDNQAWHMAWAGGWTAWQPLGGQFSSGAAAASCSAGHLDLYALGLDHGLWHDAYNGAQWSGWQPMGGSWTSDPGAVCSPGSTALTVLERGNDGAMWLDTVSGI